MNKIYICRFTDCGEERVYNVAAFTKQEDAHSFALRLNQKLIDCNLHQCRRDVLGTNDRIRFEFNSFVHYIARTKGAIASITELDLDPELKEKRIDVSVTKTVVYSVLASGDQEAKTLANAGCGEQKSADLTTNIV